MDEGNLKAWLDQVKLLVNGRAMSVDYAVAIYTGEKDQGSKAQMFRVKLDANGCIVGPDDSTVVLMEGVPSSSRAPVNPTNIARTDAQIHTLLSDPTGTNAQATNERHTKANDYHATVVQAISEWRDNCPYQALTIPSFSLPPLVNDDVESYWDYLKEQCNMTPEDVYAILEGFKEPMERYFEWYKTPDRPSKSVEVKRVM